MAFNTKIKIDDQHVEQGVGTTLTLSGNTRYGSHPTFTGDTQIVDKKYVDDNIVTATGSTVYSSPLLSPAAVAVGGIDVGYVLTGKTSNEIIQDLLFPEICGTLTAPSTSTSLSQTGTREVGCVLPSINVTSTFSRGSIDPQGCSDSPFRSGAANSYVFSGTQVAGTYSCTTSPVIKEVTGYTVGAGANTWGSCTFYDAGVQPKSNKNNDFSSPLGAGNTTANNASLTGLYPYFYGVSASEPTADSALLATGSKIVATSTAQINITYGSQTNKYLWFATPAASTTKLGWYEGPTNKGNIGSPSDLFDAPSTVSVDSPDSCWSGQSYKIYISNYPTDTSANAYCMTNTAQQ